MTTQSDAGHDARPDIDTTVPHSARIWNYWLGGKDNFAADRAAGDQYRATFPGVVDLARASRAFLKRSVRYLAGEAGVRQFLDIGTGLPTFDNTHEVAQRIAPDARIVYVDNDPLVLVHARALLVSTPQGRTAYMHEDLHHPDRILAGAAKTLDLAAPVAIILSGVLGHVPRTDDAQGIIRSLLDGVPSGSYLAINDGTSEDAVDEADKAADEYAETGAVRYNNRRPEEIAGFFAGLELVEPGVVSVPLWRPDPGDNLDKLGAFGGVGRKP
ncbi:SAM-dependent methyltransferase [Asanoa sp. NPDC049518]|uniref:SAM-dependent methyltransferase n=1 Tax=unclassified Asanoa TaxID=2685164 RepID=UPI0034240084